VKSSFFLKKLGSEDINNVQISTLTESYGIGLSREVQVKKMAKYFLKSQKGQALVEFALILPVFILVLFSIIEFSRLWQTVNVITSAAREGVRVAAVTAPSMTQVKNAAQNVLSAANIENAMITVSGPNAANEVMVTVSMNYTPITGSIVPGVGGISLSRSTTMRWEG
jgi:Flp pilus assembly protein TadG